MGRALSSEWGMADCRSLGVPLMAVTGTIMWLAGRRGRPHRGQPGGYRAEDRHLDHVQLHKRAAKAPFAVGELFHLVLFGEAL